VTVNSKEENYTFVTITSKKTASGIPFCPFLKLQRQYMFGGKTMSTPRIYPVAKAKKNNIQCLKNSTKTVDSGTCLGLLSGCMQCEGVLILAAKLVPQQEQREINK
jgi:hypothetical protein